MCNYTGSLGLSLWYNVHTSIEDEFVDYLSTTTVTAA